MWRKIARGFLWFLLILVVAALGLAGMNAREAQRRSQPVAAPALTPGQKAQVSGALRLQREMGDQVWPGFAGSQVPVILFNDRYEFLVGLESPPAPWERVEGDDLDGTPYLRRAAANPQSFAVPVGTGWAASLGSTDLINRELFLGLRRELPPPLAQLLPYPLVSMKPDHGQVALLHEIFHVHQALQNPERFLRSEELYNRQRRQYPYAEESFAAAWDREGQLLADAMKASDEAETRRLVAEFLAVRRERREKAGLSPGLVAMEQEREWLEGLALYVETRSHEVAAAEGWTGFRPGLPHWQTQLGMLQKGLGRDDGDTRFYVSGMAMARLLDRLRPEDWKAEVLRSGVTLEELLVQPVLP